MDLTELANELDEIRPEDEDASDSMFILMAKLGQMAESGIKLQSDEAEELPQEKRDAHRRDLLAGTVIACAEYAAEHDVDMDKAVEERIERMREIKESRKELAEAAAEGDAQAVADALRGDSDEDDGGDSGGRMFQ